MKFILLLLMLAVPAMAQKKVWEVEVALPQGVATESATMQKITVDATGNAMLQLDLVNARFGDVPVYNVVLWVSSKGSLLTQEVFSAPYYKQEFRFFFTGSSKAMIYSNVGTPSPSPTWFDASGPVIITLVKSKSGMSKSLVYLESEKNGLQLNEGPQARMAAYATTTLNVETQKVKITLWRAW